MYNDNMEIQLSWDQGVLCALDQIAKVHLKQLSKLPDSFSRLPGSKIPDNSAYDTANNYKLGQTYWKCCGIEYAFMPNGLVYSLDDGKLDCGLYSLGKDFTGYIRFADVTDTMR